MEKERKQWQDERSRKDAFLAETQGKVQILGNQVEDMKEQIEQLESDLAIRAECEEKVNEYVQELVKKNQELTA